ncbi:uncharacterized protein SPAPADRAFT_59703 [Spathaspora passalidarum NRRL Y-27907]|uniref:Uncharacterized protein n=1 Tax=Spathaspora passalidarum (strain NRRL Y-27907 / 11-Y1) TaxID=619300 RepID=G3AHX3_SPAPN|nr:uncharacterized protein SPAPADRAFT_59703 [Spathaspora passalidarum NRRL Y-27907]EGW34287.1 hypothetical protein SPAPADRAFT_59703 [Spathaspora passalidarum NRRL Y-27907]
MPSLTLGSSFEDSLQQALKKQKTSQFSSIPTSTQDYTAHKHHHKHHHHHHGHHNHHNHYIDDNMTQEKQAQYHHHHHHHQLHKTTDAVVDATHGTITPISHAQSLDSVMSDIAMSDEELTRQVSPGDLELITEKHFILKPDIYECPCGHFHGPGQDAHHDHDIHSVGLSDHPLLQGPE